MPALHEPMFDATDQTTMSDPLKTMLNEVVVLDTTGPIVYIGTLVEVTEHTFVLKDTDMHDCRDGHASKEQYVAQTRCDEVSVNRKKVIVMNSTVISLSRLEDIVRD